MLHGGSLNLSPSPGYESDPGVLRQHAAGHAGLQPCLPMAWACQHSWAKQMSGPIAGWETSWAAGGRGVIQQVARWHTTSGHKQHLFLSFTAGTLFFPRCCLQDSRHTRTEKGELQDLWRQRVQEVISQLWCHPWHRASLAPPVGPLQGTNLPPIKTGIMLLAYRRSINKW